MENLEIKDKDIQNGVFYNLTRSICPVCKTTLDAQIIVKGKKVVMRKRCKDHGWFESLISSDFEFYRQSEVYNKPGTIPFEFQTEVQNGCPEDCGICPEHKQHTCLGILEITSKCNMDCPICFAATGSKQGSHLPLERIIFMIDTLLRSEGPAELIQLSGGEPTLHPDLLTILERLETIGTKKILINTNGRKFAKSLEFCKEVKKVGKRVGVYLQFDGFKCETYEKLRGNTDLLEEKLKAIENLKSREIPITLVMTVVKGINDDEMGEVLHFMHENSGVGATVFQPLFAEGHLGVEYNPIDHLTVPDVIKGVEEQTEGSQYHYVKNDWFPIPCPHPYCSACTFSYFDPESEDNGFTTLKRLIEVEDYLDYFKNSTLPNAEMAIKDALQSIFSFSTSAGSKDMVESYCAACGIEFNLESIEETLKDYIDNIKLVTIKPFQSAWDLDVKRLMKCCIHEVLPDGRIIPFCAYNTLYRDKIDYSDFQE